MKRNMDLVRKILLVLEEHEHGFAPKKLQIEGHSNEEVAFHVHLMGEAGLLEVYDDTSFDGTSPEAIPAHITWNGYEFLDAARSPSIWEAAKQRIVSEGLGLSFEVLKGLLTALTNKEVGLT
ncbi:MAG: DUF2513 domain-containing protein [Phycisphaerae bacterium]